MPGAEVVSRIAGAASSSSGTAISTAARPGRRSAPAAIAATRECEAREPPIAPALTRVPSSVSSPGSAATATTTLRMVATPTVTASDSSNEPGWTKAESPRAASSVAPAETVVRPAVARLRFAASWGSSPAASSSRKRETIRSE